MTTLSHPGLPQEIRRRDSTERANGALEVEVKRIVKDLQGNIMFDGIVKHIYTFADDLIKTMDIELVEK